MALERAAAGRLGEIEGLESRLVWIFGSPRSGSTWLLELLAYPLRLRTEHPAGFSVPKSLDRSLDVIPVNESLIPYHLAPPVPSPEWTSDAKSATAINDLFEQRDGYALSRHHRELWAPELRRFALVRLQAQVEAAAALHAVSHPLVVIKEPNGSHAADRTMELLPDSRMILLLRDGRDVVDSVVAAFSPDGFGARVFGYAARTGEQRLGLVRRESAAWVDRVEATERAWDRRPAALRRRLRYEDLLTDPAGELDGLMEWLGLRRGRRWLQRSVAANDFAVRGHAPGFFRRSATPGQWRQNLDQAEQRAMEEIMGEALRRVGYGATKSGD